MKPTRRPVATAALALALAATGCSGTPTHATPICPPVGGGDAVLLWAQAVPSAAYVPCIAEYPAGWSFGGQNVESGRAELWLDSDRAAFRAVTVLLTPRCDLTGAVEVPAEPDAAGLRRFEEPTVLPPGFVGNRYYVFPGGCVTFRFNFTEGGSFREVVEVTDLMSFVARAFGVRELRRVGMELCGRGVDCPG